jgi:membrane protein implicated in regulation of membrane protease activity
MSARETMAAAAQAQVDKWRAAIEERRLEEEQQAFRVGSTEAEVLEVMGTPTSRMNVSGETWLYYGLSRVVIENGVVSEYENWARNLRIRE